MKRYFNKKAMVLLAVGVVAVGSFSFAYPGRMGGYGSPFATKGTPVFSGDFGPEEGSATWGPGYGMRGSYAGMPCQAAGYNQGSFDAVDTEAALENYLEEASVELELVDKVTYDTGVLYAVVRAGGEARPIELIVNPAGGIIHSPGNGGAYRGRAVQDPLLSELTLAEAETLALEALEKADIEGTLIEGHSFNTSYSFYLDQDDGITHVIHVNKWNGFVRTDAHFGTIETIEREEGDA